MNSCGVIVMNPDVGQGGGGEEKGSKGENSMAVSGLGCRKPLVGSG